jgi:hypothetical protein
MPPRDARGERDGLGLPETGPILAPRPPTIACEDVPLDEARRLSHGPRMDPQLYQQLRARLQSLSGQAVCMTIADGTSPTTMNNRILRVAAEFGIAMTIRCVSGGLLFWRSNDEGLHQAHEISQHVQTARRKGRARPGRRRRAYRQDQGRSRTMSDSLAVERVWLITFQPPGS